MRRPTRAHNFPCFSLSPLVILCASVAPVRAGDAPGKSAEADLARQVLDAAGVAGGLVVHLGCGDGRLTAALHQDDSYLVHGLDTDANNVARARQHVRQQGLYGKVTADRFDGEHLPYVDGLVNVLVAENPGDLKPEEMMRVLRPGGVALVSGGRGQESGVSGERVEVGGTSWVKTVKPWPDAIDQWTHYLHDASNDGVARDTCVGPPRRLKWDCGPAWSRSHEHTSSMIAMVSAGGRLYYILDEGLTGVTPAFLPEKWTLTARDAFNGVHLWKHSFENFRGERWGNTSLRGVPGWLRRLLVAEGDRLFLPVGLGSAVSILDAATGEVLATCDGTEGAQELRCLDGTLLVQMPREVLAFDAADGRRRWQAKTRPRPSTLAAQAGRVFFLEGPEAVCLDLNSGKPLWKNEVGGAKQRRRGASLLVACGERVLVADGGRLTALAADSGEQLWSVPVSLGGRGELFVAQGQAWHWQDERFVGHDLATGQVKTTVNADEVFTPGHHLRCYQSKATENYIITPYRGVEFVSITGREHSQHDWVRGACTYGVMPANGLLYTPPHPCFCYPGVKLTGLNALAAGEEEGERGRGGEGEKERLERGPAYGEIRNPKSEIRKDEDDWPVYRHDARRTGATDCGVPAELAPRWDVKLDGPLTPPVAAGGRVYVAGKDAGVLYALDAADGRTAWTFVAGGPIDSPPSVLGELVLFGSADGCVYCLRAADGALAWRFRAAPSERRIVSHGRLESPWRVHGSVLVHRGKAYCTAGRSTYLDGGIRLFALDPATGKVLHQTTLDTWARTREDAVGKPFVPAYHMEGSISDVLVCENDSIYMGQYKLDTSLVEQPCPYVIPARGEDGKPVAMDLSGEPFVSGDVEKTRPLEEHQRKWLENAARGLVAELREEHGAFNVGHRRMGRHVLANFGLLDGSWFNRTFWMYSETWPGFYLGHRGAKSGQLLVVGPEKTYAVQAYPYRNMQSPLFTPGETGYLLLADANDNEPVLDYRTRETTKGWGFTRAAPPVWHQWVPVLIRAMTLAADHLFIAGPPDVVDPDDPMAPFEGRAGAVLRAVSARDGKTLSELQLPAPPVFDGLIATPGRLLLSTTDGRVVCLGSKP